MKPKIRRIFNFVLLTIFSVSFLLLLNSTSHAALEPPTISPYSNNLASYHAYTKANDKATIGSLGNSTDGNFLLSFYNDYDSAGTIRVHVPEGEHASITLTDLDSGEIIPTADPLSVDFRNGTGAVKVAYLLKSQKIIIRVSDPTFDKNGHYPIYIDYLPDDSSSVSEIYWLEAAISRDFRSHHEAALTGYLKRLEGVDDAVSRLVFGIDMADTVAGMGSAALTPKYDPKDAKKVIGYLVDSENIYTASNLVSSANTVQKTVISAGDDDAVSLGWQNGSAILDGAQAMGQLLITGNPKDAYQTIIVDFAKASVYANGVFATYKVEKGINAHMLVKLLMATHISDHVTNKFPESYVKYMAFEWADYTEDQCGWFEDFAGCGLDNYDEDVVWGVYSNAWDAMQNWISRRKIEQNWYADVDHDGYSNESEVSMGTDPNDATSPPPPEYNLDVTLPIATTSYKVGDLVQLRWNTSDDLKNSDLTVNLIKTDNSVLKIADQIDNAGIYSFFLPKVDIGSGYQIELVSELHPEVNAYSANLSVILPEATPSIESWEPTAWRVFPEYTILHDVRGGDTVKFRIQALDNDGDLSHVIWSASDKLLPENQRPTAKSDYVIVNDEWDRADGEKSSESTSVVLLGKDITQYFYVYATVFDKEGNKGGIYWQFEVEPTFSPNLSPNTPNAVESNIGLGTHDILVNVSDVDDNLNRYEVYLDNVLLDSGNISGGNPLKIIEVQDVNFPEKRDYLLNFICYDEDDLPGEVELTIHAGIVDNNIHRPYFEYAHIDEDQAYDLFRLNKGYQFEARAVDEDSNLVYVDLQLNDEILYQNTLSEREGRTYKNNIYFKNSGANTIKFTATDSGGESTVEELIVNVLGDDGTGSNHLPELLEVTPDGTKLYGSEATINIRFRDYDADLYMVEICNGASILKSSNISQDSTLDLSFDIPTGTNTVDLWLTDLAGNRAKVKSWTTYSTGGSSVAPSIITIQKQKTVYVKQGEYINDIAGYVYDASGDLDYIQYNCSEIGCTSLAQESVSGMIDNFDRNIQANQSDRIFVTAYDEAGNHSATDVVNVTVVADLQSHSPQILSSSYQDGDIINSYTVQGFWSTDLLVFDPDGDLMEISAYKNGIKRVSDVSTTGELYWGNHIYEDYNTGNWQSDYTDSRGVVGDWVIMATDSLGNTAEISFTVKEGPLGDNNHAPEVPTEVSFSMKQDSSYEFTIPFVDEENDDPVVRYSGLDEGDSIEELALGQFLYTPANKTFGEKSFIVNFDDGFGGIAETTVNVSIEQVFYPPAIMQGSIVLHPATKTVDLGTQIAPLVVEDSCAKDEIKFVDVSTSNGTVGGYSASSVSVTRTTVAASGTDAAASDSTVGGDNSLSFTITDTSIVSSVTARLMDLGGRTSNEFVIQMVYLDSDNDDGAVNLKNVITGLQVLTGANPAGITTAGDINSDNRIGLEEVLHELEKVSQ